MALAFRFKLFRDKVLKSVKVVVDVGCRSLCLVRGNKEMSQAGDRCV